MTYFIARHFFEGTTEAGTYTYDAEERAEVIARDLRSVFPSIQYKVLPTLDNELPEDTQTRIRIAFGLEAPEQS